MVSFLNRALGLGSLLLSYRVACCFEADISLSSVVDATLSAGRRDVEESHENSFQCMLSSTNLASDSFFGGDVEECLSLAEENQTSSPGMLMIWAVDADEMMVFRDMDSYQQEVTVALRNRGFSVETTKSFPKGRHTVAWMMREGYIIARSPSNSNSNNNNNGVFVVAHLWDNMGQLQAVKKALGLGSQMTLCYQHVAGGVFGFMARNRICSNQEDIMEGPSILDSDCFHGADNDVDDRISSQCNHDSKLQSTSQTGGYHAIIHQLEVTNTDHSSPSDFVLTRSELRKSFERAVAMLVNEKSAKVMGSAVGDGFLQVALTVRGALAIWWDGRQHVDINFFPSGRNNNGSHSDSSSSHTTTEELGNKLVDEFRRDMANDRTILQENCCPINVK